MARKSKYTPDQRVALRKARQKKQEKYWEDRAQSRVLATDRQVDDIRKDSDRAYRDARDAVRREIDKFYQDFATAAGISEDEARQKLSRGELQDFKKELERKRKIIQAMLRNDPDNDKLRTYDTEFEKLSKVRELTRKEALETNIKAEIVKLGGTQEQQLDARSQNVVRNALWMNSADLSMLGDVKENLGVGHPKQVERAARENWQYGDFSARIWDDKEKLIREAREIIENGFAHNKGAYDMAGDLMTRMNVSHSNALRLVRTEFNHLSNQAALAEYQAKGIRKYKFVSAIDSRTCDVCADLNGQVFNVADAKVGLNFPPMHPNCRSVTTPVIDWDDEDEWDYSGIELDDDELKQLGLTDEDVSAIDADTPMATDAPAPSLSVQQANQATEDTQSVQRRAEQAEAIKQQTQDLEVDVRKQMERLDDINDDIKRLDDMNRRLDAKDVPMTLPRAAVEAENLERIDINLKEKELEVLQLQERASKLDPSVPKPDREAQDLLANEIDEVKTRREERQKKELSDAEIIAQSLPKPKDALPVPKTAKDADSPRTAIGKLWMRLKGGVEMVRERLIGKKTEYLNSLRRWIVQKKVEAHDDKLDEQLKLIDELMESLATNQDEIPDETIVAMTSNPDFSGRTNLNDLYPADDKHIKCFTPKETKALGDRLREENKHIDLTETNFPATSLYVDGGYRMLNALHRSPNDVEDYIREYNSDNGTHITRTELKQKSSALSNEIAHFRLSKPVTTKRIIASARFLTKGMTNEKTLNGLVGREFTDAGFVSTSIDLNYDGGFGGNSPGKTVMYIDVPAGARAAYIAGINNKYATQEELLLDKGTKFRIIEAGKRVAGRDKDGQPVEELFIHAEVIP